MVRGIFDFSFFKSIFVVSFVVSSFFKCCLAVFFASKRGEQLEKGFFSCKERMMGVFFV